MDSSDNGGKGNWQGFAGGLRIYFGDGSFFDLVCGQSGRRYPSGKLDDPIKVDNYLGGRLRELLRKCDKDDSLDNFVMNYDGNDRKSRLLVIQTNKSDTAVEVDGVAVKRIKKLSMPSCIYDGLEKIIALCGNADAPKPRVEAA